MKHMRKRYTTLAILFSLLGIVGTIKTDDVRIRSQSVDTARELSGWTNQVNLYHKNGVHGSFAITPEYTQSFNERQIARSLFGKAVALNSKGKCNKNSLSFNIAGSQAANRQANDLLADYFGLPRDYQSIVTVKPTIQNFLVDFNFFMNLDDWLDGFWVRIHAPLVYALWKLRLYENIVQPGTSAGDYPAGYFAPALVSVSNLNNSFISYLNGATPTLNGNVTFKKLENSIVPGSITNIATNKKLLNYSKNTFRLSDIRFAFGWNFWQDTDYHIGLGIVGAAPTGNRVNDQFLFQPMVGNGHHWELGGKITTHYIFWENDSCTRRIGFYSDADITYMFQAHQYRVFDLRERGNNSRYMLASVMTSTVLDNLKGNTTPSTIGGGVFIPPALGYTNATSQFVNMFVPVANLAAQQVKVSQLFQVDVTGMFSYTHGSLTWDIGYNFWATGCEIITPCRKNIALFQGNTTYALKGDAYVIGFDSENSTGGLFNPVNLSATESQATIYSGTNYPLVPGPYATARAQTNTFIDNAQYAFGDSTGNFNNNTLVYSPTAPVALGSQTQTSILDGTSLLITRPGSVFLSNKDVDVNGAQVRGLSNKIFTHISYSWEHRYHFIPYFGIGGKVEFASDNSCNINPNITDITERLLQNDCFDHCRITNISEWGIWLKGGVTFN